MDECGSYVFPFVSAGIVGLLASIQFVGTVLFVRPATWIFAILFLATIENGLTTAYLVTNRFNSAAIANTVGAMSLVEITFNIIVTASHCRRRGSAFRAILVAFADGFFASTGLLSVEEIRTPWRRIAKYDQENDEKGGGELVVLNQDASAYHSEHLLVNSLLQAMFKLLSYFLFPCTRSSVSVASGVLNAISVILGIVLFGIYRCRVDYAGPCGGANAQDPDHPGRLRGQGSLTSPILRSGQIQFVENVAPSAPPASVPENRTEFDPTPPRALSFGVRVENWEDDGDDDPE